MLSRERAKMHAGEQLGAVIHLQLMHAQNSDDDCKEFVM
jgi:hypothetical protein